MNLISMVHHCSGCYDEHVLYLQVKLLFGAYCAVKKVFCKTTSETIENQFKISKKSEFFRKRPDASECVPMHPNASQWVRMDPNGSEHIRKPRKTCENLKKTYENIEKLRENFYKNFFHGVVTPC